MAVKRKLTHFSDPGHGWVSVSFKDLIHLGIVHDISSFSYMNATRAFLEEDSDFSTFMNAAQGAGWDVQIRTSYYENCFVRSLGNYKPYFVENPLQIGSQVIVNRDELVTVVDISPYGYILKSKYGARYRVPRSNPYRYVRPPADAAERLSA